MQEIDVGPTELSSFPQITTIRGQITHTGRYKNSGTENELSVSKTINF